MGLFSFFKKNKQDRAAEDSGRFYSKDEDAAIGERARAKRASNAGGGAARRQSKDPMLPEKKRARRRLVGAVALALAAAVGLPMLLDSEPKPVNADIAIQVPSKEKAAPLPLPDKAVAAEDSVDQGEEVIPATETAKPAKPAPAATVPARDVAKLDLHKPEPKEVAKPEHKEKDPTEARLAERERQDRARAERDRIESERAERAERIKKERADNAERLAKQKAEEKQKAEQKPVKPVESARAIAILEDKPKPEKEHEKADNAGQRFVLQVAAMSSAEKAAEVQAKLQSAGISSWTQKTSTASGELIRVRIGPLSRDDAEKMRARLKGIGLSGAMTPV